MLQARPLLLLWLTVTSGIVLAGIFWLRLWVKKAMIVYTEVRSRLPRLDSYNPLGGGKWHQMRDLSGMEEARDQ